ncbi:hypothetical protein RD792_000957, partial [Penstemon davidsonii]
MGDLSPRPHWIPEDDVLLKNAVQAGASLESLAKGAVQFSQRYTLQELKNRWYSLLYVPVVSEQAAAQMIMIEDQSRLNNFGIVKESTHNSRKRKAEIIRKYYYSMRKRICTEPSGFMDNDKSYDFMEKSNLPCCNVKRRLFSESAHIEVPEFDPPMSSDNLRHIITPSTLDYLEEFSNNLYNDFREEIELLFSDTMEKDTTENPDFVDVNLFLLDSPKQSELMKVDPSRVPKARVPSPVKVLGPEYSNGVISCKLNMEDQEIPSNDDVFLLFQLPSPSYSSRAHWRSLDEISCDDEEPLTENNENEKCATSSMNDLEAKEENLNNGSSKPNGVEPWPESDFDVPHFSDVEELILGMDLSPDEYDSFTIPEVIQQYKLEETKRTIIRLEQAAAACTRRAIAAHGAFAVLYSKHSKHFIKKSKVLLGRESENVKVDIDLEREYSYNGGKFSRRQAMIKMDVNGLFRLKNLGKCSIYVNGKQVVPGQSLILTSGCLIEQRTKLIKMVSMILILLLLVPLFLFVLKHHPFGIKNIPPGPNVFQILWNISLFVKKPHIALKNLSETYGLFSFRLGAQLVVVASSPLVVEEILKTRNRISSGRYLPSIYYNIPEASNASIVMSRECNDTWRFLRRIGHNCIFSTKAIESTSEIRKTNVMEMLKFIKSKKEGKIVDIDHMLYATFTNIMNTLLTSRNLFGGGGEGANDKKLKAFLNEIVEETSNLGLTDLFPILNGVDFWKREKAKTIYQNAKFIWGDIINERSATQGNPNRTQDFLDILKENAYTDDEISIVLTEQLIAGTDPTTMSAVWLMTELIKNQEIMCRVREEIANQAIERNNTINESFLSECQYFQACIMETLRLHTPSPLGLPHRAIETCIVNNYVIPRDTIVLLNIWAIHVDSNNWEDAASFKPERFLESRVDVRRSHFKYIPFGSGQRQCPGLNIALKSVQLVVAYLVHYFDWSLPDGMDPSKLSTTEKFRILLRKEEPLYLIPKLRDQL